MTYSWEKESLQKYGEETTSKLIKRQQEYEKDCGDNDCPTCGTGNEGTIIEWEKGKPIVMHHGLYPEGYCRDCGRYCMEE
jgi:hypothetical protein